MLFRFQDHNSSETETVKCQLDLEKETTLIYRKALEDIDELKGGDCLLLQRERHVRFLKSGLLTLPGGTCSLWSILYYNNEIYPYVLNIRAMVQCETKDVWLVLVCFSDLSCLFENYSKM